MKRTTTFGAAIEAEAVYGTAETIDIAEDALLLAEDPGVPETEFAIQSARGMDPATGRPFPRGARTGKSLSTSLLWNMHGKGSVYATGDDSLPWVDAFRLCGMQAIIDLTPSAENIILRPRSDDVFEGATVYVYPRGDAYKLRGARGTFTLAGNEGGMTKATFDIQGMEEAIASTLALPALTYPTVVPPIGSNISMTIGDFLLPVVRDWEFSLNAIISPATNINNASGLEGLILTYGIPELSVTIEETALVGTPFHTTAGLNTEELLELATAIPISLDISNAGDFSGFTLNLLTAQLESASGADDGPLGLRDLVFTAPLAGPTSIVDFNITFPK